MERTAPLNSDGGIDDQIVRMDRLLNASSGEHGLISESDFICSTRVASIRAGPARPRAAAPLLPRRVSIGGRCAKVSSRWHRALQPAP